MIGAFVAREKLKVEDLIAKGVEAHQAGQFVKAEKFYRRALKIDVENTDILHLLGVLSHQKGRHGYAVQLTRKALIVKPDDPDCNTNLAIVLYALSCWPKAESTRFANLKC